jgi:hypothetical protein
MDIISRSLSGSVSTRVKSQNFKTKLDKLMKCPESSTQIDVLESIEACLWRYVTKKSVPEFEDSNNAQNATGFVSDSNLVRLASSHDPMENDHAEYDNMLWSSALENPRNINPVNFDVNFQVTDILDLY